MIAEKQSPVWFSDGQHLVAPALARWRFDSANPLSVDLHCDCLDLMVAVEDLVALMGVRTFVRRYPSGSYIRRLNDMIVTGTPHVWAYHRESDLSEVLAEVGLLCRDGFVAPDSVAELV